MDYMKPGRKMHTSMRGTTIDMDAMRNANEGAVAVTGRGSDLRMNARGDLLGHGGHVHKRREQIEQEYNRNPEGAVQNVSLKGVEPDVFETPQQAIDRLTRIADAAEKPAAGTVQVDAPANVISKERARKLIDKAD